MSQDQILLLLFKILLVADLASVIAFLAIYTALAPWWHDNIGRTIAIKDILLGLAFTPSILSLFFHLSRSSSRLAGWFDVGILAGIAAVMTWRCVVWFKIHREGSS